jgi:maltose alpha-D-glucosyltransferase/alpha-amylase
VNRTTPHDWYRDAVVYQLHVRSFADSSGDGTGDFDGLTERLDYLVDLGVDTLWLLPFFPSPLRDDGYDIADYRGINPSYGDMTSFRRFLTAAHARGLRVIIEMVLNHTSDQHPWFQRARRAPRGSRYRNFYVWSDTPDRYTEADHLPGLRDVELDVGPGRAAVLLAPLLLPPARPQLREPDVQRALFATIGRWLRMGVDGVRLDAVPYLFEQEGTNCENLPATHAFLRKLRAHVDAHFPGRMLLAEANQWPEDAVAYFGDGDECHMAFHFPVMPRLFMACRWRDRTPIVDILEQTPEIPAGCQWAMFLRNHDELTLEMVTDEERDYMYRRLRRRPAHADQPRHPAAPRAAAAATTAARSS